MKNKKKLSEEKTYIAPDIDVVNIELEQNILQAASGTGETQQLNNFDWEDW